MNQQLDPLLYQTRIAQPASGSSFELESQADNLLDRAMTEEAEQAALLETPNVEAQYMSALAAQIESKHDQVERIEDRLENLIEQQSSRLQQSRSQQPGLIALPGTKAKWQSQVQQQQSTMQRLQGRLEAVREIKEGMGVHGPRIEELAARKLKHQEPGLSSEWDEEQASLRRHQALQRKNEMEQRQHQRDTGKSLGMSQGLVLSVSTRG